MNERLFICFCAVCKGTFHESYLLVITIAAPSGVTQVSSFATSFPESACLCASVHLMLISLNTFMGWGSWDFLVPDIGQLWRSPTGSTLCW